MQILTQSPIVRSETFPLMFNLYPQGSLPPDGMVTRRYRLEALDCAITDMHSGVIAKGVLLLG